MDPPSDNSCGWDGTNNPFMAMAMHGASMSPFGGMPFTGFPPFQNPPTQGENAGINGNSGDLTGMWEAIHKIQEAQDSIVKAFESTSTVVKALKDSNERTLRSVASHSTRIQAMENGMERTPSSPAMAVNEQKARALLEGPSKAQTSMTLFGSPKKANNDRLSLLSTDTVNRMMKEMAERVAALERENGQMMNDMRKLKEEFTHDLRLLRKDGDWVCNKVKDLADRLYTVEGDCTQLWRKTQGLELRGDTSGNYPACYGSEHGLFKNKIHNLEARCDSLKKKLGDFEGRLNWLHVPSKPIIAVGEHESDPAIRQALKDITTPREDLADIGTARLPMSVTGSEVSSIRSALAETRTKAIQDQVSNKAAICNLVQSVGLLWEVMMSIDTSHTLQGKKHRLDVQQANTHAWKSNLLNAIPKGPSGFGLVHNYKRDLTNFTKLYDVRIHGPHNPTHDPKFCGQPAAQILVKCCDMVLDYFNSIRATDGPSPKGAFKAPPPTAPASHYRSRTPPGKRNTELVFRSRPNNARDRSASPREGRIQSARSSLFDPPERRDGRLSSPFSGTSSPTVPHASDRYTSRDRMLDPAVLRSSDRFKPRGSVPAGLGASSWSPGCDQRPATQGTVAPMLDESAIDELIREGRDNARRGVAGP